MRHLAILALLLALAIPSVALAQDAVAPDAYSASATQEVSEIAAAHPAVESPAPAGSARPRPTGPPEAPSSTPVPAEPVAPAAVPADGPSLSPVMPDSERGVPVALIALAALASVGLAASSWLALKLR